MADPIIDAIIADVALGHSLRGACGHQRMTKDDVMEIISGDPELERELEIAEAQALYNVEEQYIADSKISTRNMLMELGVRDQEAWGKAPAPRVGNTPNFNPQDDEAPRIAPGFEELFNYTEAP